MHPKGEKGVPDYELGPDQRQGKLESVKLDPAGLILRPTPSDHPLDPLNWPKWKKRTHIMSLY